MIKVDRWKTVDEIEFLSKIGTHSEVGQRRRQDCIDGYRKAIHLRKEWDLMDDRAIGRTADAL